MGKPVARIDPTDLRNNYLALMAKEWRSLRLEALDPAASDPHSRRPVTLEQVYVSLDTTTPRPEKRRRKKKDEFDSREEEPPLSAVEALWHVPEGQMVLLGQPGSGKSTFARHLALAMAQVLRGDSSLKAQLPDWKGSKALLPVFIALGRLAAGIPAGTEKGATGMVKDFIRQQIDERPDLAGYGSLLLKELKNAGGLVIFDGLDEVPGDQRQLIRELVSDFAALYNKCKMLVTCRTHSYRQDKGWHLAWPVHELAPFSPDKINEFIDGWYDALSEIYAGADYGRKAEKLKLALSPEDRRGLVALAGTPLMLTVMAIVHTNKTELPESRVEVYRECVDILLLRWHTQRTPESGLRSLKDELNDLGISDSKLNSGLLEMAYEAHKADDRQQLGGEGRALVSERTLRAVMRDYLGDEAVERFLAYCQHANGLLLAEGVARTPAAPQGRPVYAFPHLSFEEYLAALYLRTKEMSDAAKLAGDPAWREVVRFLGESLCFGREVNIGLAQTLLEALCPEQDDPEDEADWRRIWLAGELLPVVRSEASGKQQHPSLDRRIVDRLVALLETPAVFAAAPQDRAAVGRTLSALGDPRPGVGCFTEGKAAGLPEMAWVAIPGTEELRLGEGDEAWPEDAEPLQIGDFYLAAYPVTVAQYRPFVEQGGYAEDRYWTKAGREDRGGDQVPYFWKDPQWHLDNHPVIGVTWYEAVAYCRWLTERLQAVGCLPEGYVVRLPTEAEWEWAARGSGGRGWPWDDEWHAGYCNSEEADINRTTAVGGFPGDACDLWQGSTTNLLELGDRYEVIHDLAGNVWEWCSTKWQDQYPLPNLKTEWDEKYLEGEDERVLRGGSWYFDQSRCRGAARFSYHPRGGHRGWGFRCCVATSSLPF